MSQNISRNEMKWELKIRLVKWQFSCGSVIWDDHITSNCCNAAHTHLLVFSKSVRSRSRSMRIVYISAECPINYNIMDRNEHYSIIWTQIFSDTSLKSRHLKFTRRHLRGREGCLPVLKNALTHMHEYLLCSQ